MEKIKSTHFLVIALLLIVIYFIYNNSSIIQIIAMVLGVFFAWFFWLLKIFEHPTIEESEGGTAIAPVVYMFVVNVVIIIAVAVWFFISKDSLLKVVWIWVLIELAAGFIANKRMAALD